MQWKGNEPEKENDEKILLAHNGNQKGKKGAKNKHDHSDSNSVKNSSVDFSLTYIMCQQKKLNVQLQAKPKKPQENCPLLLLPYGYRKRRSLPHVP